MVYVPRSPLSLFFDKSPALRAYTHASTPACCSAPTTSSSLLSSLGSLARHSCPFPRAAARHDWLVLTSLQFREFISTLVLVSPPPHLVRHQSRCALELVPCLLPALSHILVTFGLRFYTMPLVLSALQNHLLSHLWQPSDGAPAWVRSFSDTHGRAGWTRSLLTRPASC